MSSLSAAEAWALAAKVYAVEAQRSAPQERAELREHAAALLDHARKLDDGADLIVRAQDYLESRVLPAAHYDRPVLTPSAHRRRLRDAKAALRDLRLRVVTVRALLATGNVYCAEQAEGHLTMMWHDHNRVRAELRMLRTCEVRVNSHVSPAAADRHEARKPSRRRDRKSVV